MALRLRDVRMSGMAMLLVGIVLVCQGVVIAIFAQVLGEVRIKGPLYQEIVQEKDVVADVLPPPEYIVETYGVTLELLAERDAARRQKLVERIAGLEKDFLDRQAFWNHDLGSGPLRDWLTERSRAPAARYFEVLRRDFVPAIQRGDLEQARTTYETVLRPSFEEHRAAIDEVVKIANATADAVETTAVTTLDTSRTLLIVVGGLATLVVALATAFAFTRGVARPIRGVAGVVNALAAGDFSRRAGADVHGRGEIGAMAYDLDQTLDSIAARVDRILNATEAAAAGDLKVVTGVSGSDPLGRIGRSIDTLLEGLRVSIAGVGRASDLLANSSHDLTAVSTQLGQTARMTNERVLVVSSASEEVSRTAEAVSTAVHQMNEAIKNIARSAADAARVAASAVQAASATNTSIVKLGDSSAEIDKVVKVITTIAKQTNLLALNATIEAARAGEHGKGFAVVANEVKELSRQTAQATDDVREKIGAIHSDMANAVDAIRQISKIIEQIDDISNAIAGAVEEQSAVSLEIGRNVAESARGSAEIARSVTDVAASAREATQGAQNAQGAAADLARMSTELKRLVAQLHA